MTNLHKIRARIRSVNSTQQITRTMKMIAVSKLRKTQTSLAGVRLFADKSQAVLNALLAGDASFEHPYLTPRRHVGRVCYVVFWGNRGLCGAYNQLLLRHLEGLVRAEARPCSVIVCGRWGRDVLAGTDLPVRQIFSDLSDTPTMAEALEIAEELKNLYHTGEADEIHLVYQHFDSVLHQTPTHRQLLPAAPEASLSFTPWAKRARTSRSSPSGRPTPRVGAKMWGVMTAAAPTQRKPRASISRFIWARALS